MASFILQIVSGYQNKFHKKDMNSGISSKNEAILITILLILKD
jgi:hypothetical protein